MFCHSHFSETFLPNAPALFAYAERAAVLGGAQLLVVLESEDSCAAVLVNVFFFRESRTLFLNPLNTLSLGFPGSLEFQHCHRPFILILRV